MKIVVVTNQGNAWVLVVGGACVIIMGVMAIVRGQ